jgi:hypothetical protein
MEIILPDKDITLLYSDELDKLCKPLHKFGITFFNYIRVYPDGSVVDLCNNPAMQEFFYYQSEWFKHFSPFFDETEEDEKIIIDKSILSKEYLEIQENKFDISNVIFFITKNKKYNEYWQFGTVAGNKDIFNFYLNNTELLKSFINYFKLAGADLIKLSEANSYKLSLEKPKIALTSGKGLIIPPMQQFI